MIWFDKALSPLELLRVDYGLLAERRRAVPVFWILAERLEPSGVTKTGGLAPFRFHQTAELNSGQFLSDKAQPQIDIFLVMVLIMV